MDEKEKMDRKVVVSGNIVTDDKIVKGFLSVVDGKIAEISYAKPDGYIFDPGEVFIVPGFIDLHIHGVHYSLVDNGRNDLSMICKVLPEYGVTGFLPTVAPRAKGEDVAFLSELSQLRSDGAQIAGFHLEGPFLKITGALQADAVVPADSSRVQALIEAAGEYKLIFSISPDVEGIERLIPLMAKENTPVFITHTAASVTQTQIAIESGAHHATHFYNVFPCPDVVEPGVRPCGAVEAILADERVSVDFILDGVHVDPIAVKMAMKCKPAHTGKVCLITDSNIGTGLAPGRYLFGNNGEVEFAYKGAPARSIKDNTLAGSGLTMVQALRNAIEWLDLDLVQAVRLVSSNPAGVIGVDNCKGFLRTGYDADFVILDREYNVLETWINGQCYYKNNYINTY